MERSQWGRWTYIATTQATDDSNLGKRVLRSRGLGISRPSTRGTTRVSKICGYLRPTSHSSQEPWPCNGEDPWLSPKGHSTMSVGKVVLGIHGPLTLPNPILFNAARSSMRLRSGSGEVRMLAPVGPFFWPSPFWPLDDFFYFFLLNLGSTAPNYPRRPLMRSRKAPPNKKNRGLFCPNPPEPTRTTASEPHWTPRCIEEYWVV